MEATRKIPVEARAWLRIGADLADEKGGIHLPTIARAFGISAWRATNKVAELRLRSYGWRYRFYECPAKSPKRRAESRSGAAARANEEPRQATLVLADVLAEVRAAREGMGDGRAEVDDPFDRRPTSNGVAGWHPPLVLPPALRPPPTPRDACRGYLREWRLITGRAEPKAEAPAPRGRRKGGSHLGQAPSPYSRRVHRDMRHFGRGVSADERGNRS